MANLKPTIKLPTERNERRGAYRAPRLTEFGQVAGLTQSGTGQSMENSQMMELNRRA